MTNNICFNKFSDDVVIVEIENSLATAAVSLYGGPLVQDYIEATTSLTQGAGELGRIFLDNQATCVIEDPAFNRQIRIEKTGSNSTAVWNPGLGVASKMDDLGAVGWRDMVCVESANALENSIWLEVGASHKMVSTYSVDNLS